MRFNSTFVGKNGSLSFKLDKTIRGTVDVFPLQPVLFQFLGQLLYSCVLLTLYKRLGSKHKFIHLREVKTAGITEFFWCLDASDGNSSTIGIQFTLADTNHLNSIFTDYILQLFSTSFTNIFISILTSFGCFGQNVQTPTSNRWYLS